MCRRYFLLWLPVSLVTLALIAFSYLLPTSRAYAQERQQIGANARIEQVKIFQLNRSVHTPDPLLNFSNEINDWLAKDGNIEITRVLQSEGRYYLDITIFYKTKE